METELVCVCGGFLQLDHDDRERGQLAYRCLRCERRIWLFLNSYRPVLDSLETEEPAVTLRAQIPSGE